MWPFNKKIETAIEIELPKEKKYFTMTVTLNNGTVLNLSIYKHEFREGWYDLYTATGWHTIREDAITFIELIEQDA